MGLSEGGNVSGICNDRYISVDRLRLEAIPVCSMFLFDHFDDFWHPR